jgi:hypothetical protein
MTQSRAKAGRAVPTTLSTSPSPARRGVRFLASALSPGTLLRLSPWVSKAPNPAGANFAAVPKSADPSATLGRDIGVYLPRASAKRYDDRRTPAKLSGEARSCASKARVGLMGGITQDDRERLRRSIESDKRMPYELEEKRTLNGRRPIIDEDDCALIRCMRAFGRTAPQIAEELEADISPSAISTHARGACAHDTAVPPTVLCREASDGDGRERQINHDETQKRRREWREEIKDV